MNSTYTNVDLSHDLVSAAAGDPAAIERVYHYLLPRVARMASSASRMSGLDAADLEGDVMLRLVEQQRRIFQGFNPEQSAGPSAYLMTIVRRQIYRSFRYSKSQRRVGRSQTLSLDASAGSQVCSHSVSELSRLLESLTVTRLDERSPEEWAMLQQQTSQLARWREGLSSEDKELFRIRVLEERPSRELAVLLKRSPAAIDQQAHRLRKSLGEWIQEGARIRGI